MLDLLREELARILCCDPWDIDPTAAFNLLGADSIIGVQSVAVINRTFGMSERAVTLHSPLISLRSPAHRPRHQGTGVLGGRAGSGDGGSGDGHRRARAPGGTGAPRRGTRRSALHRSRCGSKSFGGSLWSRPCAFAGQLVVKRSARSPVGLEFQGHDVSHRVR
ncbi:acyl carrier protein [Streptomyces sp. NPDC088252]|uniref:acyl carrier protein n=1 Tax=Streptomyces sp. NPDC088252 TaxID=3365845 RepID=UPI00381EF56B